MRIVQCGMLQSFSHFGEVGLIVERVGRFGLSQLACFDHEAKGRRIGQQDLCTQVDMNW